MFEDTAAADEYRTANLTGLAAHVDGVENRHEETATLNQPEALRSAAVSPNYFNVLGVSTLMGRTLADGEDQPGRDHVVILSHQLWVRRVHLLWD